MDVLVVEDDDGVRENLAEFLADSGFQVEQAESAEDGLMLMEGYGLPGVLVTDLDLGPGIGGLVLAQTEVVPKNFGDHLRRPPTPPIYRHQSVGPCNKVPPTGDRQERPRGWRKASGYNRAHQGRGGDRHCKQVIGEGLRFRKDGHRTTEMLSLSAF
jgi:hypothetical protein